MSNPLLSRVKLPGRRLTLPSSGEFYRNGEVADSVLSSGEVEVLPMSARAELKLKSPDLLYSGEGIAQVIRECVPEVLKPQELFSKDLDAILLFLRTTTYGNDFITYAKHGCREAKEHTHSVNLETIISKGTYLTKEKFIDNYTVVLPNEQVVKLQPLRFSYVLKLMYDSNAIEEKMSADAEDAIKLLTDSLLASIYSIDGITDSEQIKEWAFAISMEYVNIITEAAEKANETWGFKFEAPVQCAECGDVFMTNISINPTTFFSK